MFQNKSIILAIMPIILVGFFLFALPDKAFSQAQEGCCRNNGNQCPECGSNDDFCMSPDIDCNTFVAGQFCLRVPGPDECQPNVCCLIDNECKQVPQNLCEPPGTELGVGACGQFDICLPPPPTGCCETGGPTCTPDIIDAQCAGDWTLGASCDGNFCGQAPPPIAGCCQTELEGPMCEDRTNVECADDGGAFFPGGMCTDPFDFCQLPPEGCCVIEPGVCEITTENACNDLDGAYQGDGSSCEGNPECVAPIAPIPTIGEWGMITMAGLLGLFSLFIIIRRHRYNVG